MLLSENLSKPAAITLRAVVVESSNLIKGLLAKLAVASMLVASIVVTLNLPTSGVYVNG